MSNIISKCCLVASLSFMSFGSLATPSEGCGPEPLNWIDSCPSSIERIVIGYKVQVRIPCDNLDAPTLVLTGPIKVFQEAGDPVTHTLNYEVLSLNVRGRGVRLRAGIKQGLPPTLGQFTQLANGLAQYLAFYKFAVNIPSLGLELKAKEACWMTGVVNQLPPSPPRLPPLEYPCYINDIAQVPLFYGNQQMGCLVTEGLD